MKQKNLVTGLAGFIGSRMAYLFVVCGHEAVGVDNINNYYDVRLKYAHLKDCGIECENKETLRGKWYQSSKFSNYRFVRLSVDSKQAVNLLFGYEHFDIAIIK